MEWRQKFGNKFVVEQIREWKEQTNRGRARKGGRQDHKPLDMAMKAAAADVDDRRGEGTFGKWRGTPFPSMPLHSPSN
jgi:hypothetical protein